jgi:hypothetical protein
MYLNNGSWFRAISAESRQRGGRPRVYALDDPEYDPKASTSMSILRSVHGAAAVQGGHADGHPPRHKRPVAGHFREPPALCVARNDDGVAGRREQGRQGPAFRPVGPVGTRVSEYTDEEGNRPASAWPTMWPISNKVRDADPKLKGLVSLEDIKFLIGPHNYMAVVPGTAG